MSQCVLAGCASLQSLHASLAPLDIFWPHTLQNLCCCLMPQAELRRLQIKHFDGRDKSVVEARQELAKVKQRMELLLASGSLPDDRGRLDTLYASYERYCTLRCTPAAAPGDLRLWRGAGRGCCGVLGGWRDGCGWRGAGREWQGAAWSACHPPVES